MNILPLKVKNLNYIVNGKNICLNYLPNENPKNPDSEQKIISSLLQS